MPRLHHVDRTLVYISVTCRFFFYTIVYTCMETTVLRLHSHISIASLDRFYGAHFTFTFITSQNRTDDLLTISVVTVPQDDVLNVKTPTKNWPLLSCAIWDIWIDPLACGYNISYTKLCIKGITIYVVHLNI